MRKLKDPLVSIIVPVYNVEPYLTKCITSIIKQTYRKIEIILVNDGSSDGCGKICDEFAKKDERIRVFHTENKGLSVARNYGMARATGDYLGFVDSDDWIEPDMFEVLVKQAEKDNMDIVHCGIYLEFPKKTVTVFGIEKYYNNSTEFLKALIKGDITVGVWNKLYRKSCFKNIVFPEGHVFEDTATMHKIFTGINSAVGVSKPLYHYRKNRKDSIVQNYSMKFLIDLWLAHKSRYDFFLSNSLFSSDKELMEKMLYWCAIAIARTWRYCYASSTSERGKYEPFMKEMRDFALQHFPVFGMSDWPFFLRFSIFMTRFNRDFVFALLYFLCMGYKWMRDVCCTQLSYQSDNRELPFQ